MTATSDLLFLACVIIAISGTLIWRWKSNTLKKQKNAYRTNAYDRLVGYCSRSDHPRYEFSGKDATVVLSKEEFIPKNGQLAGKFIYLCRNAFDSRSGLQRSGHAFHAAHSCMKKGPL